ncbi:MAG TPA: endospore germination permease [Symbiobacteriaceae bacterium]|nr:endospore germination permease [Symbiobacteriaceae bacterium]
MLIIANKLSMLTTYAPIVTGAPATRDAWLSAWLAAAVAFLIALVPFLLMRRFPGQTLFAINVQVLGTWAGRVMNLAYALLFFHLGSIAVRLFSEVFVVAMLPETPIWALNTLIVALAAFGVLSGFEVLGRLADLVAPMILLTIILLTLLSGTLIQTSRLFPLLEYGPGPVVEQSLTPITIFGEMSWTLFLAMPYIKRSRDAFKGMAVAAVVNGAAVSFGAALLIAMMGPELIDREVFPTLTAVRLIRVAEFLTRIEWVMAALWMGAMFVKIGLIFWGVVGALRESGLPKLRQPFLLLIISVATSVWSQWIFFDTLELMATFQPANSLPLSLPVQLFLPLLTLTVALLRGQRGTPQEPVKAHG